MGNAQAFFGLDPAGGPDLAWGVGEQGRSQQGTIQLHQGGHGASWLQPVPVRGEQGEERGDVAQPCARKGHGGGGKGQGPASTQPHWGGRGLASAQQQVGGECDPTSSSHKGGD